MESERFKSLGAHVVNRRRQLGWPTRQAFADNINLVYRVLSDLENGSRRLGAKAYAEVERALRWQPGSVDAVLAGGDPAPVELDPTNLPPLSSVDPFRGIDSLRWRLHIESKPEGQRTEEERAWLAGSRAEQSRLGERAVQPDEDRDSHVSDFLTVAELTWEHVTDLADSPEGDPEREVKALRAIVTTADTLTDALLRLHIGPAARPLIQDMSYRSHELMKDQIYALQAAKNAGIDMENPPSAVEEHFESALRMRSDAAAQDEPSRTAKIDSQMVHDIEIRLDDRDSSDEGEAAAAADTAARSTASELEADGGVDDAKEIR